jgi:hypothetical protein
MIYIFDIDGTLSSCSHRLHLIQKEPKDWPAFFAAATADVPIWEIITVARALSAAAHEVVLMTGRPESSRALTVAWMGKYRVPFSRLLMRKEGDHREDFVIKAELLESPVFLGGKLGGVFEDRQQNVDMFREKGLKVFQVDKGAY